jgi:hypothetical protein
MISSRDFIGVSVGWVVRQSYKELLGGSQGRIERWLVVVSLLE